MNNPNRPVTTLFMIESLDGKISTGDVDELDVDKDFKRIVGVKEGLHQYYNVEKQTDLYSLNTGRVMAKIGVNERTKEPTKMECSFIIIDSKPHLTAKGVEYLAKWVKTLYLVTTNKNHPAYKLQDKFDNIVIIYFDEKIHLAELLAKLKSEYQVDRITIQSGGTLNSGWLREKLVDHVSIVVAPCLIGGENTQSLIGGESLHTQNDLKHIKALKLVKCDVLADSYLHLTYDVVNETEIDE
ncbi:MAG: RibD domain protein [Candidatus Woesebacteria bacterium GW2011_GWB1_38_5b]|uniref:RibD domain protein n=1 Tax=Candidatus Woesebacteria bacterium GW2011_GWB1_38_5b TaxID=1618569 RepID=A0A0G0K6R0_9BACT|nr:MAG: RibD domain protein [Candidatus Woesebacteria bacterium GW2011_GWB1_38_5b]